MYAVLGVSLCAAGAVCVWLKLRGRATPIEEVYNVPVAKVSKLYVYPVKSCHRIEVDSIECFKRGLKYDRAFVVVDQEKRFVSQRAYPRMALIQPRINFLSSQPSLFLTAPGMEDMEVKIPDDGSSLPTASIQVWDITGEGMYMGEEIGVWFSKFLGVEGLSLYYMSSKHKARKLTDHPRWTDITRYGDETSFSDFAPLLLVSEASMELLNSKLRENMELERFRPNIVLSGCMAHAEDSWPVARIGPNLLARNLKPCTRCKMVTVHQEKGEFSATGEPNNTLFDYRLHSAVYEGVKDKRFATSPIFGCHYTVLREGTICTGSLVHTTMTGLAL